MSSLQLITVNPEKCVGCNACVRTCPVSEANITERTLEGGFITTVQPDKCISCGECIRTCTHEARDYIDDTDRFFKDIKSMDITLVVTPAIKSAFKGYWKQVLKWFKRNGITRIYDASYGADICTWAHLKCIDDGKVTDIVTQPCAAIVNYVTKYLPDMIPKLSPVHSPIACECIYIRKYLRVHAPIAVLTPCIAKKSEFVDTDVADYNITFKRLMEYFNKNRITFTAIDREYDFTFEFEDNQGVLGSIYPRPGGLRDNIWLHNQDINITTSEGVHKVYPELELYSKMPDFKHPEIFDVLSCEYGCNTGPASGHDNSVFDVMETMRDLEKDVRAKRKTKLFNKNADKQFDYFNSTFRVGDFMRTYESNDIRGVTPTKDELNEIFENMGKTTLSQQNYNCNACGYRSCEDMATAIFRGLNVPDNCIVYAKQSLAVEHKGLKGRHEEISDVANEVNAYATNLLADIESIYASLNEIRKINKDNDSKASQIEKVLGQIVSTCEGTDELAGDDLRQLAQSLSILRTAMVSLKDTTTITLTNSGVVEEAMKNVAAATTNLNRMVDGMLTKF